MRVKVSSDDVKAGASGDPLITLRVTAQIDTDLQPDLGTLPVRKFCALGF